MGRSTSSSRTLKTVRRKTEGAVTLSYLDNEQKMLKGIGLFNEQQEEDAKAEVALLQKLGKGFDSFEP